MGKNKFIPIVEIITDKKLFACILFLKFLI